jgi:hypothetical protein
MENCSICLGLLSSFKVATTRPAEHLTGKGQQLDVFDTSMAIFGVFGVAKLNFQGVGRVM